MICIAPIYRVLCIGCLYVHYTFAPPHVSRIASSTETNASRRSVSGKVVDNVSNIRLKRDSEKVTAVSVRTANCVGCSVYRVLYGVCMV